MTREERNLKQRLRRQAKKDYIIGITGDKSLASRLRDKSYDSINEVIYGYKVAKVTKDITPVKVEATDKALFKAPSKRSLRYKKAVDMGYTAEEARRMRDISQKKFEDIIGENRVYNVNSRVKKWARMSKNVELPDGTIKSYMDKDLERLAEEVNLRNGFDPNSRYGYSVVYSWYTNGGEIEFHEQNILADPFDPDVYADPNGLIG